MGGQKGKKDVKTGQRYSRTSDVELALNDRESAKTELSSKEC